MPGNPLASRGRRATFGLIALLLVVVAACWAVVALFGAFPGDRHVAAELAEEKLGSWGLLPLLHVLDRLGDPPVAVATIIAAVLTTWRAFGWRHAALVTATTGTSGVALALEALARACRIALSHRRCGRSGSWELLLMRRRWAAAFCAAVAVAAMGPSRLLLGVHWTSDVLAGYAVGLAWLLGLLAVGLGWARADDPHPDAGAGCR